MWEERCLKTSIEACLALSRPEWRDRRGFPAAGSIGQGQDKTNSCSGMSSNRPGDVGAGHYQEVLDCHDCAMAAAYQPSETRCRR